MISESDLLSSTCKSEMQIQKLRPQKNIALTPEWSTQKSVRDMYIQSAPQHVTYMLIRLNISGIMAVGCKRVSTVWNLNGLMFKRVWTDSEYQDIPA